MTRGVPQHTTKLVLLTKLTSLCAVLGCTSGQTGGQVGDEACSEDVRSIVADQATSLEFTAQNALEFATGLHSAPLRWQLETTSPLVESITVTPADSAGSLSLNIEYVGGPIVLVERRSNEPGGKTADLPDDVCPDSLRIEVQVMIHTSNGAFDDVLVGQLEATSPTHAALLVPFKPATLQGVFSVEIEDPEVRGTQFRIEALISEGHFSGMIHGALEVPRAEEQNESTSSPTPRGDLWIRYGHWPDEQED